MYSLTLQIFNAGQWHDAMTGAKQGKPARFRLSLAASGLPARTMNHPGVHMKNLEKRMKEWDLQ